MAGPSIDGLNRLASVLHRWHAPKGARRFCAPAVVGLSFAAVTSIVYATGGTKFAHAHLFYVPILLSAFCFGLPGGIIGGVLAGLFAGPFIPLDVAAGIPQSAPNWLARAGYFALIGGLAGGLCKLLGIQVEAIRCYAYFDPLTKLPNKVALRRELAEAIDRREPLSLIRLQIARFEDINAAFGYRTADALLQAIAERLARLRPANVTVYYLYAAHFGILCRGADECRSAAVARDLLIGLKEPFAVGRVPISIEGRIGYARCPDHATEEHGLLRAATFALYDAEASVREIRTYDVSKHQEQQHALRLLADLRGGIEGRELLLVYQPKVSLRSGACVGVEALARWRHPIHGMVPPGQFVSIAEKTTIVKPLTEWVIRSALEQLAAWRAAGLDLGMAVNISVRNLEDPQFPELLQTLITSYRIPPERLELEITEGAIMAQAEQALAVLHTLKGLNIRIAIDDFGTGHSSLSYLKELPVDTLKIDQCFVRQLAEEPRNRKIVRAAIDLAHDMDLEVVAEGVETREVYDYIRTFACDAAQGYFISRPIEADSLAAWLERVPDYGCQGPSTARTGGAPTVQRAALPGETARRPSVGRAGGAGLCVSE